LKENKGQKCRLKETNNSLATKIKKLFQVLSTKTELYKRKPNIYTDPNSILCTDQEAEPLDYLTCYIALEPILLELRHSNKSSLSISQEKN
ncbi:43817_t:CDS:1, partial [Gigaspora margarita]